MALMHTVFATLIFKLNNLIDRCGVKRTAIILAGTKCSIRRHCTIPLSKSPPSTLPINYLTLEWQRYKKENAQPNCKPFVTNSH